MKSWLTPNIGRRGRLVRGLWAALLLVGAWFAFTKSAWLGGLMAVAGGFALFEALRGWCVLRACGIKTKL